VVKFLITGDCLLDGRESYFSLKLKTNTFTAFLSGGITSIIKKVTINLPSNSNQILEEIDSYNTLASIINTIKLDDDRLEANWQSGLNCLKDHNRTESQQRARSFLNLNEGGYRMFTFQLNLCSVLFHEQYLPLSLLNGVLVEIHLTSAQEAFYYNPANEAWTSIFGAVENLYFAQNAFDAFTQQKQGAITDQLTAHFNRPDPAGQALEYEIREFTFHVAAIWMNAEYVKRLVSMATSDTGINLFLNSYRFNQLPNEGSLLMHVNLTEQYQNLKRILMVTLNKNSILATDAHSTNMFENFIKTYKFRIGSRSWQVIPNVDPAMSYTQTLQSLGMLPKSKGNSITFATYPRSQNVHIFDFEKVRDETHSGEDTTNGRNLRLEMEFNQIPALQLVDDNDTGIAGAFLKREIKPADCVLYIYQQFTRMINISNAGIAVTE
jgi:hypothetical protein